MEQSGTFIQYLIARNGEVNRDFIDVDDIATLETQFTKWGKLRAKWQVITADGPNYVICIRQPSKWGPLDKYPYNPDWTLRTVVSRVKNHEKYSEVIIVAYKDAEFKQPCSVNSNSIILKRLKKYYSKELAKWVEQNQESELV